MDAAPAPSNPATRTCPECHTTIPVEPGYVTWCDHCNWNLLPDDPGNRPGLIERLYVSLNERLGKSLLDEIVRAPALRPRITLAVVAGTTIAVLVHAVTLAFAAGGVFLIVWRWPNALLIGAGAILLLIAWLLRPRLGRAPAETVTRKDCPALFRLVDAAAGALDAPHVDAIALGGGLEAAIAEVGWRRKRVLFLGVPLLEALDGQERIAVLAHELAHAGSGDPRTNFAVVSALQSLDRWYNWLRPIGVPSTLRGVGGIAGIIVVLLNLLGLALSSIAWVIGFALAQLFWRNSQRAEYRADALSATVSGTRAVVSALDKGPGLPGALERATALVGHKREYGRLFDEFRRYAHNVPERECERLRRIYARFGTRLDPLHPPHDYRLQALRANPVLQAKVVWSSGEDEQLARELAPAQLKAAEALVAQYRSRVYYWE
jgi:Zn-dependent protease with chaperone function